MSVNNTPIYQQSGNQTNPINQSNILKETDQIERLSSVFLDAIKNQTKNSKKSNTSLNDGINAKFNFLKKKGINTIKDFLKFDDSITLKNGGMSENLIKEIKENILLHLPSSKAKNEKYNQNSFVSKESKMEFQAVESPKEEFKTNSNNKNVKPTIQSEQQLPNQPAVSTVLVKYNPKTNMLELAEAKHLANRNDRKEHFIVSFIGDDQEAVDIVANAVGNLNLPQFSKEQNLSEKKENDYLSQHQLNLKTTEDANTDLWRINKNCNQNITFDPKDISKLANKALVHSFTNLISGSIFKNPSFKGNFELPGAQENKRDSIPYLMSDVICFVSSNSLTSVYFRDSLFKWICSINSSCARIRTPTLLLISLDLDGSRSSYMTCDSKLAARDFFTLHDFGGHIMLSFQSIKCFRIPSREYKYIEKKDIKKGEATETNKSTFQIEINNLKDCIIESLSTQASLRKAMCNSLSEKTNNLFLKHIVNRKNDNLKEMDIDDLYQAVFTPSRNISDNIIYQSRALIFKESDTLSKTDRYLFTKQFALEQLIRYYVLQLQNNSISTDKLLSSHEKNKVFDLVKENIYINLTKINEELDALEPCQSERYGALKSQILNENAFFKTEDSYRCRKMKANHIPISPIPVHESEKRTRWIMNTNKFHGHFLKWKLDHYTNSHAIKLSKINQGQEDYIDALQNKKEPEKNPYEYNRVAWTSFGFCPISPNNNIEYHDQFVHQTFEKVIDCINKKENMGRAFLGLDEESIDMIAEIMKKHVVSTKDFPSIPCFSCFKTDDKMPLWQSDKNNEVNEPILMENIPLVCCDDCKLVLFPNLVVEEKDNSETNKKTAIEIKHKPKDLTDSDSDSDDLDFGVRKHETAIMVDSENSESDTDTELVLEFIKNRKNSPNNI